MLEDDGVGLGRRDRDANLPERSRPDFPVVMYLVHEVIGVVFPAVQPAEARRVRRTIRGGVPIGDAQVLKAAAELCADRPGPIIAEPLPDRTSLQRATEPRHLVILD